MAKKEPEGVVIPVENTVALHTELRSRAGMKQVFEVRINGEVVKMRGLRVYSRPAPRPYGTLVLDWQTAAVKAKKTSMPEQWKRANANFDAKKAKIKPKAKKAK